MPNPPPTDPLVRVHDALLAALQASAALRDQIAPANWIVYDGKSPVPPRVQALTAGGKGSGLPTDFPYLWLRLGGGNDSLGNRNMTFARQTFVADRLRRFMITVGYDDLRMASSLVIDSAIDNVLERAWSSRLGIPDLVANIEPTSVQVVESAKRPEAANSFRRISTWEVPVTLRVRHL